jgi:hypothetical protein
MGLLGSQVTALVWCGARDGGIRTGAVLCRQCPLRDSLARLAGADSPHGTGPLWFQPDRTALVSCGAVEG